MTLFVTRNRERCRTQRGLTAREILLLFLILAGVVAGLYPIIHARLDDYRLATAETQLAEISAALERYKLDNHFYPTTEQGLDALVRSPESEPVPRNWNPQGYLPNSRVPADPWGQPYIYTSLEEGRYYTLESLGSDGEPGGEGLARDLVVSDRP